MTRVTREKNRVSIVDKSRFPDPLTEVTVEFITCRGNRGKVSICGQFTGRCAGSPIVEGVCALLSRRQVLLLAAKLNEFADRKDGTDDNRT